MVNNPNLVRIAKATPLRSFYAGRKILVAGADGFLGLNCVHALRALGADVSIVSRRAVPRAGTFADTVFDGDLRSQDVVRAAVAGQSVVFDFAGSTGPVDSNEHPIRNIDIEVAPHLSLFLACAESPTPPLVVFCSSRVVYGRPQYLPVDEAHPLSPDSLYAAHKIAAENYLHVFRRTHGLHAVILRLSNPYGPHDDPDAKSYGAINRFITHALDRQPIRIFGDGLQLRDYIHIEDTLLAFLSVAAEPRCHDEIFNLGGQEPIRLREAVKLIAATAGGSPVEFGPWPEHSKSVETGDYYSDLRKLHRFVDLPPQHTFAEGVRHVMMSMRPDLITDPAATDATRESAGARVP